MIDIKLNIIGEAIIYIFLQYSICTSSSVNNNNNNTKSDNVLQIQLSQPPSSLRLHTIWRQ